MSGESSIIDRALQAGTPLVELMRAPYDDLIEIDVGQDCVRNIEHIEGKYFVPVETGSVHDIIRCVTDNLIHPDDRAAFIKECAGALPEDGETVLRRARMRYKLLDGSWRLVDLVIIGGEKYGIQQGKLYTFLFDAETPEQAPAHGIRASGGSGRRSELTGLYRDKAFFRRGKELLRRYPEKYRDGWCVLALDIEHFKLFNDWYGREQGDMLLAQIGARLMLAEQNAGGLAGHMGQDDFVMLVPNDRENITGMYTTLHELVKKHGTSVGFMPAIGVAPIDGGNGNTSLEDYYDRAATAARNAKDDYHNRIRYFDFSMIEETEKDYMILSDFQKAMENHELFIQFQPQCSISDGKVIGAESLARWRKGSGELVPPSEFVPVLERNGFVTDLDKFVWEEVCAWQKHRIDGGHELVPVSVNVSQIDIFTIDVPDFFTYLLDKYKLPVSAIKIEITESAYVDNSLVADAVSKLRDMGFIVLMDDFGSGYSSLNMLGNLNVDVIKLDAQFLHIDGEDKKKGIHILKSVVNMVTDMDVPIIVEGVETKEQSDFLAGIGCRYVQGYYFYRPLPVEDFERLLDDQNKVKIEDMHRKAGEKNYIHKLLEQGEESGTLLDSILGAAAIYSWTGDSVDITIYNQSFSDEIQIPDLDSHTKDIQTMAVTEDRQLLYELLEKAMADRINGSTGTVRFQKPDGSICQHRLQFFFLGEEGRSRRFYGAVNDTTEFVSLNDHIRLLSQIFPDTVVFLKKKRDRWVARVAIHGLREDMGLSAEQFEQELDDGRFYNRLEPRIRTELLTANKAPHGLERFSATSRISTRSARPLEVSVAFHCLHDKSSGVEYIMQMHKLPHKWMEKTSEGMTSCLYPLT